MFVCVCVCVHVCKSAWRVCVQTLSAVTLIPPFSLSFCLQIPCEEDQVNRRIPDCHRRGSSVSFHCPLYPITYFVKTASKVNRLDLAFAGLAGRHVVWEVWMDGEGGGGVCGLFY